MQNTNELSDVLGVRCKRDADDVLFMNFFNKVQSEAMRQHGKVFFTDTSEGNDYISEDADCCDLSGWLIAPENIEKFEPVWLKDYNEAHERFGDNWCVAEWSGDPTDPDIEFNFYHYDSE